VSIGLSSYAAQLDDAKKEKQQVDNQLKNLEKEKQKEKQNISSNKEYLNSLKAGLEKKGYEKELIESKIQEILSAIETLDAAIAQSEEDYEAQLKLFQERLVIQYMRSRVGSDLIELADCNDFNDLIRRLHAMELIAKFDQDLMNSLIEKKADIEALRAQREAEEANFEAQLEKNLEELKKLEVSRSQTEERIAQSQKTLAQIEKERMPLRRNPRSLQPSSKS
jgi:peptidoglycan hydrolase CwlO-like protein